MDDRAAGVLDDGVAGALDDGAEPVLDDGAEETAVFELEGWSSSLLSVLKLVSQHGTAAINVVKFFCSCSMVNNLPC